jgi:hypothetical protein
MVSRALLRSDLVSRAIVSGPAVATRTCEGTRGDDRVGRSVERKRAALLVRGRVGVRGRGRVGVGARAEVRVRGSVRDP